MMTDDQLIECIKARVLHSPTDMGWLKRGGMVHPPLTEAELSNAESCLGFPLPLFAKRLYLEVGNGGFGPAYGLLGIRGGALNEDQQDAIGLLAAMSAEDSTVPTWRWPDGVLLLGHLGCAMYICLQCKGEKTGRLLWWEPNPMEDGDPPSKWLFPIADSMQVWLTRWLNGSEGDMFDEAASVSLAEEMAQQPVAADDRPVGASRLP